MDKKDFKLKPMREPSADLVKYYRSLYERNQTKFIRRSLLEVDHLGSEFEFDDKKLTLMGSIDAVLMLVKDENGKYYMLDSSPISQILLKKD
jgi:hypothetical protein